MAEQAGADRGVKDPWLAAMREARDQMAPLRVLLDRERLHPKADRVDSLAAL